MRLVLAGLSVLVLMLPGTSAAQQAPSFSPYPAKLPRIFVDANLFGAASPLGSSRQFDTFFLKFGEVGTFKATYPDVARPRFFPVTHVGGGVMLSQRAGLAVSYSRTVSESAAQLSATIPHPTFFNAPATATGTTDRELKRTESALNFSVVVAPVRTTRSEFRLFGGPSWFSYKAEMVQDVLYAQTFNPAIPQNAIQINGAATENATANQIGMHFGADYTYFINRVVGLSGGVRCSAAMVEIGFEPLSKISQEIRVGNTTVYLGLRVRVGRWPR